MRGKIIASVCGAYISFTAEGSTHENASELPGFAKDDICRCERTAAETEDTMLICIYEGALSMKTYIPGKTDIERKWYVVDATDKTLGRLASEVANVLRGKNKAYFTPFLDCGDYVIVVNADKIKVSGKKMDQKIYFSHSEYVGGAKYTTLREMMRTKPVRVVEHAIRGMLPKGKLGDQMYTKLHVYQGAEHNHAAQKPEELNF